MDLPYPVLLLLKATFHDYFLHPSWTSSHWVCLCVNEYWCSLVKCFYEKKEKIPWEKKWEMTRSMSVSACPFLPLRGVLMFPDGQCPAHHTSDAQASSRTLWLSGAHAGDLPPGSSQPGRDATCPGVCLLQMSPSLSADEPAGESEHCLA